MTHEFYLVDIPGADRIFHYHLNHMTPERAKKLREDNPGCRIFKASVVLPDRIKEDGKPLFQTKCREV